MSKNRSKRYKRLLRGSVRSIHYIHRLDNITTHQAYLCDLPAAEATMARNKSGRHDRRGFDFLLQFHLASGVISLLILIFYHWMIGLAALMYCCLAFIVLEIVSSPPVNNPDNFALWVQRRGRGNRSCCAWAIPSYTDHSARTAHPKYPSNYQRH